MTTSCSRRPLRHLHYSRDNLKTIHKLPKCCRCRCCSVIISLGLNDGRNPQFRCAILRISFTEVVGCIVPSRLCQFVKLHLLLPKPLHALHQQNVNRSGSHTQSSQKLRATSPVLLSTSRCSQTPLELSKVLSDSPRAVSGASESTCSYGGAFRMLRDLTYRIVKFWSF